MEGVGICENGHFVKCINPPAFLMVEWAQMNIQLNIRLAMTMLCLALGLATGGRAAERIDWGGNVPLPRMAGEGRPNPGVARSFYGFAGGRAVVAGGANFCDVPLVDGGRKVFHDEVYALDPEEERPEWRLVGRLPRMAGEGGCATTARGIVCVGGADGAGAMASRAAFMLSLDGAAGGVRVEPLPPFPFPVSMPAAAAWGERVFVVGGGRGANGAGTGAEPESNAWEIDLSEEGPRWKALPRLPVESAQPAAAVQTAEGGRRALYAFADEAPVGETDGAGSCWRLVVAPEMAAAWERIEGPAGECAARAFTGAVAMASGNQHVIVFGGGDREVMRKVAAAPDRLALFRGMAPEDYRFARRPRVLHTMTGKWFELEETPFPGRCGAAVVALPGNRVLVSGGEIAGGVRTDAGAIGRIARTKPYSAVNLAVVAVYLVGMALMGVWFMRRNRTTDDYFRGGGRVPWWVASLSIYATMFSSITFLSIPALAYAGDWSYWPITFGIPLLAPVVTRYYLPFFRKMNLTSAYEYLEVRFNATCRLFASAAFILFMVARTAVVTYLPAVALCAVLDVDINAAIVAVSAVTVVYCVLGGVEAVVWSDFVQSLILFASIGTIVGILTCGTDGGFAGFVEMGRAAGKFRAFDWALDWSRPTFWVVFAGGVVANLASYTSDQCVVQRYMTTTDEAGARKSILFNGALSFVNSAFFFALGTLLWTFYRSNPAMLDVSVPKTDSILPIFIATGMPDWVSGLILSAVAAATMSTVSANLNSAATAFTVDFWARVRSGATDRERLAVGRAATVATGVLGGAVALMLANMEVYAIYDQFQRFLGVLTAGLGCLFFMGRFMKNVNGIGAAAGLVANYVVAVGLDVLPCAGKPHLLLYGALGMAACLVVAPTVSAATKDFDKRKDTSK